MVLNAKNGNSKPRASSNAQNIPPRTSASRSLAHRLRSSVEAARRHNRTNNIRPTSPQVTSPRRVQKRNIKAEEIPLTFQVRDVVNHADVEMGDATPSRKTRITLSRELLRPQPEAIDPKKIAAIDEQLVDLPPDVLRMNLDLLAPEFTQSLGSVTVLQRTGTSNALPTEINVLVSDSTVIYPTHILAVTNIHQPANRRKINLYPVHSLVLAAQCAKMPLFPPTPAVSTDGPTPQVIKLPVLFVTIPHPPSFTSLLVYLYCKNPMKLAKDLMPLPPPATLFEDHSQVIPYATKLAVTFTDVALLRFASLVHGVWQNACAFAIDDETLWTAIDTLWEVFISALSLSTGQRQPAPAHSSSAQQQEAGSSSSPPTVAN